MRLLVLAWEHIAGNGESITRVEVTPEWLVSELEADRWERVISTIPRPALCLSRAGLSDGPLHSFTSY